MYSAQFNLLFIHIPKTAGQSITNHFLSIEAIHWDERRKYHIFHNGKPELGPPQTAHFTLDEYYQNDFLSDDVIDKAIKFAIVRNPWARLWSEYNFHWSHIYEWDEFFNHFPDHVFDDHKTGRDALRHIKPQNEFINDSVEILRFENLKSDFEQFCIKHDLPNRGLPTKINTSNAVNYQEVYDPKKISIVYNLYGHDITQFGYEFAS